MAIVTFSKQVPLIQEVVRSMLLFFSCCFHLNLHFFSFLLLFHIYIIILQSVDLSDQVEEVQQFLFHLIIQSYYDEDMIESGEGKQRYMACAVYDITSANRNVQICRSTSLLIDDDLENVEKALKDHVRALYFDPDNPD